MNRMTINNGQDLANHILFEVSRLRSAGADPDTVVLSEKAFGMLIDGGVVGLILRKGMAPQIYGMDVVIGLSYVYKDVWFIVGSGLQDCGAKMHEEDEK